MSKGLISRHAEALVIDRLRYFPAVGIVGSRQAGKTTLARQIEGRMDKEAIYLDLENPTDINKLSDPQLFLSALSDKLVIIDEVQRMPELFPLMRSLIDDHRVPARFLLLGSAHPLMMREISESLAGRIAYVDLHPFAISEVRHHAMSSEHWLRGGYPLAFLADRTDTGFIWLENFVRSYVERDLPALGVAADVTQMLRFMRMIAHQHGGILNISSFSTAIGMSRPTVEQYIRYLEISFMVRRLEPFYTNLRKRLVRSPKIYLRDTGVLHQLLGLTSFEALMGSPAKGASWEGYVIEQIANRLLMPYSATFFRTHDGAEADLIITKALQPIALAEVKLSLTPSVNRGFSSLVEQFDLDHNYMIIPGEDTYPLSPRVKACGIINFISDVLPSILR